MRRLAYWAAATIAAYVLGLIAGSALFNHYLLTIDKEF